MLSPWAGAGGAAVTAAFAVMTAAGPAGADGTDRKHYHCRDGQKDQNVP